MAGAVDSFLWVCVAASIVLASASVAYYHLIYLPDRDERRDKVIELDRARIDRAKKLEQEQALAAQREEEERRSAAQALSQAKYNACLYRAAQNYNDRWDAACKRLADEATKNYANCVKGATPAVREFCEENYKDRAKPKDCGLPRQIAADYNGEHDRAKDRCLQEHRAGVQ